MGPDGTDLGEVAFGVENLFLVIGRACDDVSIGVADK